MRNPVLTIALVLFLGAASAVCVEAALFLREARFKIDEVSGQLSGLVRPTQQLEANWNAVAVTSSQVIAQERSAFGKQQAYFEELSSETKLAFGGINGTVQRFNSDILPRLSGNLDSSQQLIEHSRSDISDVANASRETLDAATESIKSISVGVSSVRPVIENTATVTANLAAITDDGRKVTDHYTQIILAPASKVKAGVLFAASIIGRVLRIL
jgi:uncharacterized protein YoxC